MSPSDSRHVVIPARLLEGNLLPLRCLVTGATKALSISNLYRRALTPPFGDPLPQAGEGVVRDLLPLEGEGGALRGSRAG